MTKEYKVNLFEFIDSLDMKHIAYYKNLSEEQKKEIIPFTLMRWLTGSNDAKQIYFLNEIVNPFVFSFNTRDNNHKELLIYLMAICGSKRKTHHKFIKVKKDPKPTNVVKVIKEYFKYSTKDTLQVLPILADDDILSFAEQLGRQPPEMTVIRRELKLRKA